MSRLNYNQLYYFYVVATEGSVKAACKKLHLTQPTISGQLKTLEDSFGFELFERKHRKLILNENGKKILKKAEQIFVLGDEIINSLSSIGENPRKDIRIGAQPGVPESLLYEFTTSLWEDDSVSATVSHSSISTLLERLNRGVIDMIIADTPVQSSKRYRSIKIDRQKLIAVGSKKFKNLRSGFPNSMSAVPYLAFSEQSQVQQDIDYFLALNKIKPDRIGRVDDDSFIGSLAARSKCIGILPERSAKEFIDSNRLMKLGELPEIDANWWVVTSNFGSKRTILRKLIKTFLDKKRKV